MKTKMKKYYRAFLLPALILTLAGCKEEEMIDYQIATEGINFCHTLDWVNQNNYPSVLTRTYTPNTYSNNSKEVTEVNVDFSVETMGKAADRERKAVMTAKEITGWQVELPFTEAVFEPGEGMCKITKLPITYVPRGRMTTWVIVFDYEKSDFERGLEERQERTITIDNRYTYASVNISESNWRTYMAGSASSNKIGLGPWSNIKAMYMVEVLETYNFYNIVLDIYYDGLMPKYRDKLRAALDEYKAKSAADPVAYPPLLDDEKNDGSWIAFQEE
ncbi:hypothetical protein LJC45_03040 [Alistipes sp. OttesenSCG-928-B03]|nr:hypothetical protein [Alistipes sp. OttesenSCG-928-B03]